VDTGHLVQEASNASLKLTNQSSVQKKDKMSVSALYAKIRRSIRGTRRSQELQPEAGPHELKNRLLDVLSRTYDLGFTAFGGPPVHFQILHRRFVDGMGKTPWIDEQTVRIFFIAVVAASAI
jgi:hypothetical protein